MKKISGFFKNIVAIIATILVVILKLPFLIIFPTRIVGRKNLRGIKTGTLIACNHFSNFDPIILSIKLFPGCINRKFLAKRELSKCKFFAFFLSAIGCIYITRGAVDLPAIREVDKNLKARKKVLIFPEGTRNKENTEDMNSIKSGVIFFAKKSNVPIIPVRIMHRPKLFRFNKIVIGEPYEVQGKTEEEVEILTQKFDELITNNQKKSDK